MARRYRLLAAVLAVAAVALIAPAPASALPDPTDLLPSLPSVGDILESILKKLVDLVVPKEVSKAWSKIVAWLVALPDPTTPAFRNLNGVRESLQASAVGLLSLSFTLAAFRYWAAGFSGDAGVGSALRRCVLAVVAMIAYPQAISTAIVGVNTLTASLVASHTVTDGLDKVLGAAFLIAAATGGLSLGLAVTAVLASLAFFAGLLVLKILLTTLLCVLIFSGPLVIALYPLPAAEWLFRAWVAGLMAAIAVPAAWALIFATGAVVGADALVFTHSKFIVSVAKPFVAVACLYLAWKAPFFIVARAQAAGLAPGLPIPGMRGDRASSNTGRLREVTSKVSARNADRFRALRSIGGRGVSSRVRAVSTRASSTAASAAARTKQAAVPAAAAAGVRLGTGAAGQAADKTAAAAGRGGRAVGAVTDAARRGHTWWAKDLPAQGAAQRAAKATGSDTRGDGPSPTTPATHPKTPGPATRPPAPNPNTPKSNAGTGTPSAPVPAARKTDAAPSKGPQRPPQPAGGSAGGQRPAGWKPPGRPAAKNAPPPPRPTRPPAAPRQEPRQRRPSPPTRRGSR